MLLISTKVSYLNREYKVLLLKNNYIIILYYILLKINIVQKKIPTNTSS